ncbi:hypothetical protein CFP56_028038 [Quercus suber]|uniref:Uncharacterized protein n=1 Tax=Quercus suber TaxID=58331 RepID=A0AAW0JX79_QUESU
MSSDPTESDDGEVVDAEVGVVLADAEGGVGEGFGFRESGSVDELGPRAALGEVVADRFGYVAEEVAKSRGGDWWLGRLGGGGGGGGGGITYFVNEIELTKRN